jgi:hypothetical protein
MDPDLALIYLGPCHVDEIDEMNSTIKVWQDPNRRQRVIAVDAYLNP